MRTEVVMPQMGESVAEGTVTTWIKEIGDFVERDEPLFEITTDKVDAEVPSPVEGVLVEKHVEPGETVEINTLVAVVDTEAEEGEVPEAAGDDGAADDAKAGDEDSNVVSLSDEKSSREERSAPSGGGGGAAASVGGGVSSQSGQFPSKAELRRTRSTPLVRRIAAEHGIEDLRPIPGTGLSGRVTKDDILQWIDEGKHLEEQKAEPAARHRQPVEGPDIEIGERDRVEFLSPQRQMIAEHMVASKATSPHAHTIHEVDFSNVVEAREELKDEFAERGVKLTYTAFLLQAAAQALLDYPTVNASMDDESIVYRGDINIGMAVALDQSLIVPVIENVDELSLLGVARKVNDVATRARNKQLAPSEVKGGTFTVSNHGVFGPEFGIPIINQPQAAIVSTGAIKKRVVVDQETGAIMVRPTSMWCLSFDHRIVDGATADKFMRRMRQVIEEWSV
ncbi:MAG: dihydrolipoamide acetyltransferase family protein [Persicimonas sp.]